MNSIEKKIIKLEEVTAESGDSAVLCHGHFNIIHPGHIRYLDYARKQGVKLVVSIQGDSSFLNSDRKHHFSEAERAAGVASIQTVDQVVLLGEENLKKLIKELKPEVLVLGKEFENEREDEVLQAVKLLKDQGGRVLFHAGETHYATSELFLDNLPDLHEQHRKLFKQACSQQNLRIDELLKSIDKFKSVSLLVIGDTIIDQYVACDALGMSSEAPVVVVRELETREYAGGAAVVAMHVRALGADCRYLSVVGQDTNATIAAQELDRLNVKHVLIEDKSRPTTFKIRYMVNNQKMFRVSRMKEHSLSRQVEDQIIEEIEHAASQVQGILISDFVYGVITPRVLKKITQLSKNDRLLIFGDLQCSSQVGNVAKFKKFDLICPTERESRIALGTQGEGDRKGFIPGDDDALVEVVDLGEGVARSIGERHEPALECIEARLGNHEQGCCGHGHGGKDPQGPGPVSRVGEGSFKVATLGLTRHRLHGGGPKLGGESFLALLLVL